MPTYPPFHRDLRDIFTLYFWDDFHREATDCFASVMKEAERIRQFCKNGCSPVRANEVDQAAYLAAIREVMPNVTTLKLAPRVRIPTYTPYRRPNLNPEVKNGEYLFNDELFNLYCAPQVDGKWLPTDHGLEAWMTRYGSPEGSRDIANKWKRRTQARERYIRRYAELHVPHNHPGNGLIVDLLAKRLTELMDDDPRATEIYNAVVIQTMAYREEDFWGRNDEHLTGLGQDFLGALGYHAICATFMGRPEVTQKIEAVMQFVRLAPGSPTYVDPTTWVAYVRK